eukprot:7936-Heterococcus_DN1.PRE.1
MVDHYNEDDDDDDAMMDDNRTVTTSSYGVATSYLRAMHTAVIILRREVHPRSTLAPLTVLEWLVLTQAYGIPEHQLEGNKVVPRAIPGGDYSKVLKENITHEIEFLKVRGQFAFFRDLSITDAHFAARAMYLSGKILPEANLNILHKEFARVILSSSRAALDSFDAALTVVYTMLQRTHDIYEIDCAALAALQTVLEPEYLASSSNDGHVMAAEVRRQLALYQQDRLASARHRKRTTLAARGLDPGGLLEKAAGGRLPEDLRLVTKMMATLWQQLYTSTWEKVVVLWLQKSDDDVTVQSFLATTTVSDHSEQFRTFAATCGITHDDVLNLKRLLQLELSYLRQQVWRNSLVKEYTMIVDSGERCYNFRMTRSFKNLGKHAKGDLAPAIEWKLIGKQAALVHTILLLDTSSRYMFKALQSNTVESEKSVWNAFKRLGSNWCGICNLGAHSMRTYWICMMANSPNLTASDYPALASRLQVSIDTLTRVYLAPSKNSPAALLARELYAIQCAEQQATLTQLQQPVEQPLKQQIETTVRDDILSQQHEQQLLHEARIRQQQQQHEARLRQQQQEQQQQRQEQHQLMLSQMQQMLSPAAVVTNVVTDKQPVTLVPQGPNLAAARSVYKDGILAYFSDMKVYNAKHVTDAYKELCRQRKLNMLPYTAKWFAKDVTQFEDSNHKPFMRHVRNIYRSSEKR